MGPHHDPLTPLDDDTWQVAAFKEDFVDGYEEFLEKNKPILLEYAAIDEDDEASEQFVLKHTQLLSEHATGFYLLHCINLQVHPTSYILHPTSYILHPTSHLLRPPPLHQPTGGGEDARDAQDSTPIPAANLRVRPGKEYAGA